MINRVELTEKQKKHLNKDGQALVEAGFYNPDLTLTSRKHFVHFLLNKFEAEYVEFARKELAADDARIAAEQTA